MGDFLPTGMSVERTGTGTGNAGSSQFTRYRSPALVHLDFTPTFTPPLVRGYFDAGVDTPVDDGLGGTGPVTLLTAS